jgi:lysophospholipase L1-like esterase
MSMMSPSLMSRAEKLVLGLLVFWACLTALACRPAMADGTMVVGMGDSIGEGVQSADANLRTQPASYLNLLAGQMGVDFPLPLIRTSPRGVVGDTTHRSRLFPYVRGLNLAVSGATVHSLLYDQANASLMRQIDSETDLVLFPRVGSQMEIVESLKPPLVVCWIGNNDVLPAVLTFDHLDASQMTPVEEFSADFSQLVQRLGKLTDKVVFANIPPVTQIGFLFDREDLIRFLGSDYGLPEGSYTTVITALLIKLGLDDGSLLQDPNYVLDASEVETIQTRVETFNEIIKEEAASIGMPVVDIYGLFEDSVANPPVFFGIPLSPRFLGGIFSLDGVHPSNIAHAIIANAFIQTINTHFQAGVPLLSQEMLETIFLEDPFVDKDGDLQVRGRPFAGLLETLGPSLGISGDFDDRVPGNYQLPGDRSMGKQFIEHYLVLEGKDPRTASEWTQKDAAEALRYIFGLKAFERRRLAREPQS